MKLQVICPEGTKSDPLEHTAKRYDALAARQTARLGPSGVAVRYSLEGGSSLRDPCTFLPSSRKRRSSDITN